MYAPPPTPPLYAIHQTILVIAISCTGQCTYEHGNNFVSYSTVEKDSLIAVLWHFWSFVIRPPVTVDFSLWC